MLKKTCLIYLVFIVFCSYSCKDIQNSDKNENDNLYPEPLVVKLDTVNGYAVNQLTGDSIHPLINKYGDTIITGKALPITGKVIHPDSVSKPKIIKAGKPKIVPAHTNVHKIPENLTIIPVNEDLLETFTPGIDTSSFVMINSYGDTIPTGVPIHIDGKVVPAKQPKPVKALAPRMKHNATKNIQYLDVEQGMVSQYIYSILEDKKGNLWFGSWDFGVSKYDGKSFTHYSEKEGLSHNSVWTILEDSDGNFWFGTEKGGVIKYDGENFTHYSEKEGISNNHVISILEEKNGNLWFGTNGGGVCKYDGESFTHYSKKEGLSDNTVLSILEDSQGRLWFGTGGGVNKFDGRSFIHYTKKEGLSNSYIMSMIEDKDGNLWFGTNGGGVNKYDGESFTHYGKKEGLSDNSVRSILEDSQGRLWFGTGGGVNKFDGENFTHYSENDGLSNNVKSIIEDKSGNIWFGTPPGGVSKFRNESFTHYYKKDGLSNNRVWSTLEDKIGNLWLGTESGVNKYNGNSFSYYTKKEGFSNSIITSLLEDKKGNLWFCTYNRGVSKYDGESYTHYTKNEGLSDNKVNSVLEDKSGNLWFGTDGGVCKYNGISFMHYTEKEGLSNNQVNIIFEDKSENLWFGTNGGVSKYDGKSFTHYTEKEGLSDNYVMAILEDRIGNLWFGTWKGGVSIYDGKSFMQYTEKEGLSNNLALSILEDKRNDIWVSTENGLSLFVSGDSSFYDKNIVGKKEEFKLEIISFKDKDGLKGLDFFPNGAILDKQNRIWWGSGKCLTMLDLNKFKLPESKPRIQLNSVDIQQNFIDYRLLREVALSNDSILKTLPKEYYKKLEFDSVARFYNYPINLELPYNLNHLTFNFSAIDWSAPHKLRYQYKLEGLDDLWSNLTEDNKADYRNIPYGDYTFKVKAIGTAKKWSDTFDYHFIIHPPWWHTWWARILYLIIFISLVWGFIKLRTAKLKKNQKVLEHKVKERTFEVVEQKKEIEAMNDELHQQNDEILSINEVLNEQKELIEQKNIHITDSINYAQQIQESVFLPESEIKEHFPESFLINIPKDIVSGDFFWYNKVDSKKIFAVVDCTGHGVPGAIMSMIGNTLLNEIVKDHKITDPSEILHSLHTGVTEALRQNRADSKSNDGMDMVICSYNENTKELYFAGARNFMYVLNDGNLELIEGDFISIGEKPYVEDMKLEFNTHKLKIEKGTKLYLLTDGYMDQFGGPEDKKFNQIPFEKLLSEIADLPMSDQKEKMMQAFSDWKGSYKQIDDVMVLGIKLS